MARVGSVAMDSGSRHKISLVRRSGRDESTPPENEGDFGRLLFSREQSSALYARLLVGRDVFTQDCFERVVTSSRRSSHTSMEFLFSFSRLRSTGDEGLVMKDFSRRGDDEPPECSRGDLLSSLWRRRSSQSQSSREGMKPEKPSRNQGKREIGFKRKVSVDECLSDHDTSEGQRRRALDGASRLARSAVRRRWEERKSPWARAEEWRKPRCPRRGRTVELIPVKRAHAQAECVG